MSKFIKFWIFIICLLFIFLILFTDNVKADSLTQLYIGTSNLSNNVRNINANTGINTIDYNFASKYEYSQNFEYIKGQVLPISVLNQQYYSLDGINYYFTCSQTQWTSSTGASYTITYADGSHATISGTDMETYCSRYNANISSQSSISTSINDNHPYIQMKIIQQNNNNSNTYRLCEIDINGQFKCPLNTSYKNINGFQVIIGNSGYTNSYQVTITRELYGIISDTQQIINNNNTNTQTIHNDNQQQYNFISNTTIDTTTTDNALDINSSMSSDTSNVVSGFMLIPINFFSTIIQSFQNQCSQVCIGECGGSSGGGHDNAWRFIFPCLNLESLVGSTIYGLIDILFAFGMLFAFVRSVKNFLYKALMLTNDAASEVGVFL